jgi:hypothetical protein
MKTNAIKRVLTAFALSSLLVALVGISAASATSSTSSTTINAPTVIGPQPEGAPAGCPSGKFCSYNQTNGGDLCFTTTSTSDLTPGCANKNQSAYDNDSVNVELFYGAGETGAYYLLGAGDYLLYMDTNNFNHCVGGGTSCAGYGDTLGNDVHSVYIP